MISVIFGCAHFTPVGEAVTAGLKDDGNQEKPEGPQRLGSPDNSSSMFVPVRYRDDDADIGEPLLKNLDPDGIADYQRYSWYLRLTDVGGHSWTGVVRCEASGALPLREVVGMANRTAAVLPAVASPLHLDPRAPQNLVPIAALERELRHRMGDAAMVNRGLRAAVERTE